MPNTRNAQIQSNRFWLSINNAWLGKKGEMKRVEKKGLMITIEKYDTSVYIFMIQCLLYQIEIFHCAEMECQ